MKLHTCGATALLLLSTIGAGVPPASAGPLASPALSPPRPAEPATPFGPSPIEDSELGTVTGRAEVAQYVNAQNEANVSNNSVNGTSETGAISFDPQSFQNLNGLSVLSANTGNNVAINASLNVNVAIRP